MNMKKKRFKILKIAGFTFLALIFLCFLTLSILRLVCSPILRINNKITAPGIDLTDTVNIGGIKQYLYFRGKNIDNPVILFLHGGPGGSTIPVLHGFQYEWEKDYTIVHWDQRNSGKTFYLNNPDSVLKTMNFTRVLKDGNEVTKYIKNKLNKDKIIILGYSYGSVLGTALVQTYPDDYLAYIGAGQITNNFDGVRAGYEAVLGTARKAGNEKDVSALESFAPYLTPETYGEKFNELYFNVIKYQIKYNLTGGFDLGALILLLTSPYYGLSDIMYFFTVDTDYYQRPIVRFLVDKYDINDYGVKYEIPVFYIMGENDYVTPYSLAKEFFQKISAPVKMFFLVPDAGHTAMIDNKKEFDRVLLEVIKPEILYRD